MPAPLRPRLRLASLATLLAAALTLAGCVSMQPPQGVPRKETVLAATAAGEQALAGLAIEP